MSQGPHHGFDCGCRLVDDAIHEPRVAPRFSRRGLLTIAAGVGAAGLLGMGTAGAVDRPRRLLSAGSALEPAGRGATHFVDPDATTTTTTTTTTTVPELDPNPDGTIGPLPYVEPEEGELLFPIVVNEGDHCGVLDNFGECRDGCSRLHQGVDIMADEGLPIRAVVDGVLTRRSQTNFYGWTLLDEQTDTVYRYFHNTADANGFEVGDRVKRGDIIGFVGDTGTSPGNFHLHFEYRPNNIPADCFSMLQRQEHVLFWG